MEAIRPSDDGEIVISGTGGAPGYAIGPIYVYSRSHIHVEEERIRLEDVDAELSRLHHALIRSSKDLAKIESITREKIGDQSAEIFVAQGLMIRDEHILKEVRTLISSEQYKADFAVRSVIDQHRRRLAASPNELLRERVNDLSDVEDRIIRHLRREQFLSAIDPNRVVIAENLTAADIVLFSRPKTRVLGCAMDFGGTTSHATIMARSLGVPAVVGTHKISDIAEHGATAIVDGFRRRVILNPTEDTLDSYRVRRKRYRRLVKETPKLNELPAETLDHHEVVIRANLEFKSELDLLEKYGARGIGLFRTELLFLMEGRIDIGEEEQFATYRAINEAVGTEVTTIRLLDLGGDKMLPMAHREHNPFLGWRGIRVLLDKPDVLAAHIRAILRASAFGPLRLLIPMVTTVKEVRQVRAVIEQQMDLLEAKGQPFDRNIPVGVMIEVPSAALTADRFAAEVDFLSIGTNDLTQYVLAVDRGNDLVSHLYCEVHPSILRLLRHIVTAGQRQGIPVSVCGEMAADTRIVPLLVGLGLDELSVAPVYVPHVKRMIRAIEYADVSSLVEQALGARDADEVEALLEEWLASHPYDLLHFVEGDPDDQDDPDEE